MPHVPQPAGPADDPSPLRRRLAEFARGFRQFWEGYWSAAQTSCG